MTKLNQVKKVLSQEKAILAKKYHVKRLGVFGSLVRGDAHAKSDIDVLVDFSKPIGLLQFINMEHYLSNKLGAKVDLVSKKGLKPKIGERILKEIVYL